MKNIIKVRTEDECVCPKCGNELNITYESPFRYNDSIGYIHSKRRDCFCKKCKETYSFEIIYGDDPKKL